MLPMTTKSRGSMEGTRRRERAGSFWSARRRDDDDDGDRYNNSKSSTRRFARTRACGRPIVDVVLFALFALSLVVTRAIVARREGELATPKPRASTTRTPTRKTRRMGPGERVRGAEERINGTISSGDEGKGRPVSLYGRAALLVDEPGFPETPPLVLSATHPKAYLLRHFLTDEECDHLMDIAKRELAPSTVVGEGGTSKMSDIRTSAGMFLSKGQDTIVRGIEERIAKVSGIPFDNGEGMQILRYDIGQKYDPHFDYFHDAVNPAPKRGGQRVATVLVYLKDTEEGGETTFPNAIKPESFEANEANNPFSASNHAALTDCTKKGIPVKSVKGDAILFFSLTDEYTLDVGSLHGACPVIRGQKWTAVKWIRVAKFDGNFVDPLPMVPLTRRTAEQPCVDEWDECPKWAKDNWCETNPEFMTQNSGARDNKGPACAVSCGACPR